MTNEALRKEKTTIIVAPAQNPAVFSREQLQLRISDLDVRIINPQLENSDVY